MRTKRIRPVYLVIDVWNWYAVTIKARTFSERNRFVNFRISQRA